MKMAYAGVLRRVALVKTNVSEELSTPFIRVTRIGELFTASVVPSSKCVTVQVFGNDSNKSKFDSGGNQEEIEFW
jgi:hypothetical protein